MDENKVIRPMDFVRLTNIDELNVIKDTKNHIGLVKEVSRDGRMSIIWIGETYSQLAWFKSSELEVVESSDASCEGCVFNNSKNYYCKDTHCIDVDRKDDIDVIYKEVKRS